MESVLRKYIGKSVWLYIQDSWIKAEIVSVDRYTKTTKFIHESIYHDEREDDVKSSRWCMTVRTPDIQRIDEQLSQISTASLASLVKM